MTPAPNNPPRRPPEAGNTLLLVLITIAVLSLVAGNLMWSASARYHVTYQSASWQEALVAAEAGVDMGMAELRKRVIATNTAFQSPWVSRNTNTSASTSATNLRPYLGGAVDPTVLAGPTNPSLNPFPDNGYALPLINLPNVHGGEGNTTLAVRVYVDSPGSYAVTDGTILPSANNTLAQNPPGTQPVDTSLQFINQPDDGASETDNQGRRINSSRWWWRIRAVGYAGVSGPTRPSPDWRDNNLRKFSFFNDWRNGRPALLPVNGQPTAAPQVSRVVEVLVQPHSRSNKALIAEKQIDLSGKTVLIDSYDSTRGDYGVTITQPPASASDANYTAPGNATTPSNAANPNAGKNIGWMGNVATNGELINANGATVQGNAMTNSGTVVQAQNVTGTQDPNFYQDLTPIKPIDFASPPPEWVGVPVTSTITTGRTIQASANPASPTLLHVNGINLTTGANTIALTAPPAAVNGVVPPGFVKIYVDGDLLTNGANTITIDPAVTAVISVTGNIKLQGTGIDNQSDKPTHLILNGIQPANGVVGGTSHEIDISPVSQTGGKKGGKKGGKDGEDGGATSTASFSGDFTGIIYAPQHDLYLSGSLVSGTTGYVFDYCGAFVANQIKVNVNTGVHFDESLRANGQLGGYKVVKWFEDTLSSVPR